MSKKPTPKALPTGDELHQQAKQGDMAPLREALKRAEEGDAEALRVVRRVFDLAPKFWDLYSPEGVLQTALTQNLANKSVLAEEAAKRRLEAMRRDLSGPNPTPLEALLVERVCFCWLAMMNDDTQDALRYQKGSSFEAMETYSRRAETAQRRFLAAVKTLATVRRLAIPPVQVNVGQNQVNVATTEALPAARGRG